MKSEYLKGPHFKTKNRDASQLSENCVVFIRHGESTWNKEGKFAGWSDVPLTEKGHFVFTQVSSKQRRQVNLLNSEVLSSI